MDRVPLKIVLCFILIFFSALSVSAEGIMELFGKKEEEPEEIPSLQELFDEMAEDIPAVALIRSEIGDGVNIYDAGAIMDNLVSVFIRQGIYRPYSITEWLEDDYTKNGQNVTDIVKRIGYEEFAVETLISSSFRKINGKILLRLGFYHIDDPLNPVYFLRYFDDFAGWEALLPDLLTEIDLRVNNPFPPFKASSIYVENFPSSLFVYSELNSGEFEFTNISILSVGPQDFREGEDIIKDLLTYELHAGQMVGVIADDMVPYHKANGKSPCEYSINGELRISNQVQLLVFNIYKNNSKGQKKLMEYQVPVEGIDINSLQKSLRYVTKIIYDEILLDSDLEKVSYNSFDLSPFGEIMYFNNFFLGNPIQEDICLPIGIHWFALLAYDDKGTLVSGNIDESDVAVFVSPLDMDGQIYGRTTARHIQQLITTEAE